MPNIYTDFTKRDYTANFERLLSILSQEVPELSDRNHSDAGISLIRLLARQTDMLSFYIDEAFAEGFVQTAKFKQSLVDLGTLVDCRLKLSSPAATTITVVRKELPIEVGEASITIPAGSQFTRVDGLVYINLEAITLPIGTQSATFDVLQMVTHTLNLTNSDFEYYGPYKRLCYNLGTGVVGGHSSFYDINSEYYWTEVDSFYRSMSDDEHFMLDVFADKFNGELDTVFLSVGDGIYGSNQLPREFTFTYYTTDGASGNCGANVIIYPPALFTNLLSVTNIVPATGGAGVESIESFRSRLPLVVQTQRRGLTELDYDALVSSIPGVLYCQTVSRASDISWPYLYTFLYVLPDGGGSPSAYLRQLVLNRCKVWGHMGDWDGRYVILDPNIVTVDVSLRIGVLGEYRRATVTSGINTALAGFFLPENRLLGQTISFTDIHRAVSVVPGVGWVEFISPSTSVVASPGDTFELGTISITYGA